MKNCNTCLKSGVCWFWRQSAMANFPVCLNVRCYYKDEEVDKKVQNVRIAIAELCTEYQSFTGE